MRDLIVFGEDFGALPSSTQHIIKHLSQNRKVLWINSIGLRKPKLSKQDLKRAFTKFFSTPKPHYIDPTESYPNFTIANIKTIPAPSYSWERKLSAFLMLKQLKPLIASLNLQKPILWISLPTAAVLCGKLGESAVVYYCGDDFGALAGVDHASVLTHEKLLVKKSNLIFVASEPLLKKFPKAKTHLISHAVDSQLFSIPTKRAEDLPKGKPILGFYGSISQWLDEELIYEVARVKQDWNLVFVGPEIKFFPALEALPNIHFLGPKPHYQLPSYSQHWQMSWLPFKNNAQIKACSPLKLMEYIAAGKPIASTKFDAVKAYQSQINTVSSSKEMIELLEKKEGWVVPNPKLIVKDNWQARANSINELFQLL